MDNFTISWANEADSWIKERKRLGEKIGPVWFSRDRIYHPSNLVKKGLRNALVRLYDEVVLFTNIMNWFIGKGKDHISMRIWFGDVEDRDGNGFYLSLW